VSGQAGYLTDVQYTGNFYQFLTPAWLAYIAAINGYAAPALREDFTYCELGCGKGITSLLLAAMHPNGEFHACDFNPDHIEYARRLQGEAGVRNIAYYPRSFAQMLEADLPQFDFIVLHGVYSWVPEPVRSEIRAFARRKLKPDGLLMVSYNALPGWAHLQPIRRMMQLHAQGVQGDSLQKAREAYAYVLALAKTGAGYFKAVPEAVRHVEQIGSKDIRYVAHEYLTPHGDPFYFADVEAAMAGVGLHFCGSMTPANNYPELMVPAAFRARLPAIPSRSALEMHCDVLGNTSFRADLFTFQAATDLPQDLPLARLSHIEFCLANLPERLVLRAEGKGARYDFSAHESSIKPIHALLSRGPASAEDIHRASGMANEHETSFLLQQLVVAGHLAPCSPIRPSRGWMQVNSALTEAAIREQWQEVPLACPETGAGSYSETVHAATLEAASRFEDAQKAARFTLDRLRRHNHPVNRVDAGGKRVAATDEEIMEYITASWRGLTDRANPNSRLLRQFGLLDR
jgi:SAM-dependent methyltransferase